MDFYFTDRKFNLLGIASSSNDAPISIYDDQDVLSISAASRTFEGTLIFSDKERDQVKSMASYGNYVLYKDENGQSIFMTIMEIEHDPKEGEHFIRAEDAGMDLINGLVDAYTATKAMSFEEYFKLFAGDSGFEIGINEINNLSRTLKWESESQTILARLLSLATQFDNAEISFSFEITGTQVVKRFVDVRKKRGADNRITLYMDKDINNIVTKANIYDLCTAIVATGGTPEGKNEPINLKGYNYQDPNGRFVLNKTTGVMQDMESVKIWSRLLSNNNPNPNAGHIQRVKTYETTEQKTLCDNVIRELEKVSQPAINYETDIANLPDNVKIGDTIYLVDENEKLFLSARVLELTRCYSTKEYKATLGDYLIQDDGVSQSLKELADQLKQATTYVWIRYADDEDGNGISPLPSGKRYIAIKQVLGVPTASDDPADYRGLWVKFVGEGVPGPPGENGQPTYTWLKYADDYQGTNMTDDPTGKYYIGLATNKLTATESTNPADYKWQLVKGEDGQDAHIFQAYAWSSDGTDRFTTTYPNENLVVRNNEQVGKGLNGSGTNPGTTTVIYPIPSGLAGASTMLEAIPVTPGERIIFSKSGSDYWRCNWLDENYEFIERTISTANVFHESVPSNARFLWVSYPTSAQVKIERGSLSTIWTPSPKDDFSNAYPPYVGTYTTFDDVQSTNPSDYTWQRILGMNGEDGKDGIAGKDGVGVSSTKIEYTSSSSGTVKPTTGWTTSIPTVPAGSFLWTKTTWTYTDGTNESGYSAAKMGEKGDQGIQGPKGSDGQTYYTWLKYADTPTSGMSDSPNGKTYIGLAYNKTTATESTNPADYSWSLIKGDKGDTGATGPQGPQGPTGLKGDRGIMGVAYMQPTQPTDTTEGVTWFKTESATSDKIIGVYTYKGGWQQKKYASATLSVESLDALSANLGEITAGIINGVEIKGDGLYSDFDRVNTTGGTVWTKGTLTMANGRFRNDFQEYTKSSGAVTRNGFSELTHEALTMASFNGNQTTTVERYLQINPFRINMLDDQGRGGNLTFQDVVSVDATLLTAYGNFEIYATSGDGAPTARRQGRLISLAGAFKNKIALTSGTTKQKMGTVPEWARPAQRAIFIVAGSSYNQYQLEIATNGDIEFSRYGTSGMNIGIGYWFGLSCVYAAADF